MAPKYACLLTVVIIFANSGNCDLNYRLPENAVTNIHYNVSLFFVGGDFQYVQCKSKIFFRNLKYTNEILLHQKDLNITGVHIGLLTPDYTTNRKTNILSLKMKKDLSLNQVYELEFNYTMNLRRHKKFFVDVNPKAFGDHRFFLGTMFEPIQARTVFPCFDEPGYKATYNFSVTIPDSIKGHEQGPRIPVQVVFGGREKDQSTELDHTTYRFSMEKALPPHTLCFVISSYTGSRRKLSNRVIFNIRSRNIHNEHNFVFKVAEKIITELENYLQTSLIQRGIDNIYLFALHDFNHLVTASNSFIIGSEFELLASEEESTLEQKQKVALNLATALAEMFVQLMVVPRWWSHIYLNKGLSLFLAYQVLDNVLPNFEWENEFILHETHKVFEDETALHTSPLVVPVSTPEEILRQMQKQQYKKGAVIFKMIANLMQYENFKKAMRVLYKQTKGGTQPVIGHPEDLWKLFTGSVPKNQFPARFRLETFVDGWVNQAGYPVVNVSLSEKVITFKQQRFFDARNLEEKTYRKNHTEQLWPIPIAFTIRSPKNYYSTVLYFRIINQSLLEVESPEDARIIVNHKEFAFYRVNYDKKSLDKILKVLPEMGHGDVLETKRIQLIDDSYNLAHHGFITFDQFLHTCKFLKYETSYHVWRSAFNGFSRYLQLTLNRKNLENFRDYLFKLGRLLFNSVSFYDFKIYDISYTLKQVMLLDFYCKLNQSECLQASNNILRRFNTTRDKPDVNFRHLLYCYWVTNKTQTSDNLLDDFWRDYKRKISDEDRFLYLRAMACAPRFWLLYEFLHKMVESTVETKDSLLAFFSIYERGEVGRGIILDHYGRNNYTIQTYFQSRNALGDFLSGLFSRIRTKADYDKLRELMDDKRFPVDPEISFEVSARIEASSVVNKETEKFDWKSIDKY